MQLIIDALAAPGQAVTLDASPNLQLWQMFATATATAAGTVRFTPPLDAPQNYFRFW